MQFSGKSVISAFFQVSRDFSVLIQWLDGHNRRSLSLWTTVLPSQQFTVDCSATYSVVCTVNSVANELTEKDFVIFKLSKTCVLSRLTAIDVPAPRGLILE